VEQWACRHQRALIIMSHAALASCQQQRKPPREPDQPTCRIHAHPTPPCHTSTTVFTRRTPGVAVKRSGRHSTTPQQPRTSLTPHNNAPCPHAPRFGSSMRTTMELLEHVAGALSFNICHNTSVEDVQIAPIDSQEACALLPRFTASASAAVHFNVVADCAQSGNKQRRSGRTKPGVFTGCIQRPAKGAGAPQCLFSKPAPGATSYVGTIKGCVCANTCGSGRGESAPAENYTILTRQVFGSRRVTNVVVRAVHDPCEPAGKVRKGRRARGGGTRLRAAGCHHAPWPRLVRPPAGRPSGFRARGLIGTCCEHAD
jgi:hypothetical protein